MGGSSSVCKCDSVEEAASVANIQNVIVPMADDKEKIVFDEQDVVIEVAFGESVEAPRDGDPCGERARSKPSVVVSEGFANAKEDQPEAENKDQPQAENNSDGESTVKSRPKMTKQKSMETGKKLGKIYLSFNQASYAMAALPIGTVLSIVPLYLKEQLEVKVSLIRLLMMAGELLGILFMKYAELSSRGFILRRPNDMNLILVAVAVCLGLIPVWSPSWWFMSAALMMLVQAFNSASKPVVAEAVHRMAVLTGNPPSRAFAKGNQWRRMGNASIGASSPLIYIVNPQLVFFIVTPVLLSFTTAHIYFAWKVSKEVQAAIAAASEQKRKSRESRIKLTKTTSSWSAAVPAKPQATRASTVGDLTALMRGAMFRPSVRNGSTSLPPTASFGMSSMTSGQPTASLELQPSSSVLPEQEAEGAVEEVVVDGFSRRGWVVQQLVVQAFPIFDAFISDLPFAWMTVAITEGAGGKLVACGILFAYQSARAVSQYIQTCCIGAKVCFLLTSMALLGYAVVLTMLLTGLGADLWYIPIALTGLAETLPVQQYFLTRLFQVTSDSSEEVKDQVRELVKQSHTGTGIGSAVAFLTSSQTYQAFGLYGVAILGLCVASLKLLTEFTISMNLPNDSSGTV